MPILSLDFALALLGCFATGTWLATALERRRFQREAQRREHEMSEALRARYIAYEGLEHSVHGLIAKFDAIESEFRQKLAVAANPGILIDQTVKLRSTNPELWDLEREHLRERSQNLNEISRQARRIAELMDQLPMLESAQDAARAELSHMQGRYEIAVANATDSEQAAAVKIARLEQRIGELQPLESMLEATRRELEEAHTFQAQSRAQHDALTSELHQRVDALGQAEARIAELESDVVEQRRTAAQKELEVARLEGELEKAQAGRDTLEARCKQLGDERERARKAVDDANAALQSTRASQAQLHDELQRCRADLKTVEDREARTREECESARESAQAARADAEAQGQALEEQKQTNRQLNASLSAAQAESLLYRTKLSAHSNHVEQAWSVLSELKPMLQELEDKLKDTDQPSPAVPAPVGERERAVHES